MSLGIIKSLKDIANWIKGVDDYIVERGTSDVWTYRKYNSGEFEMRCGNYFSFTSGYTTVTLPEDLRFSVSTKNGTSEYDANVKRDYIVATGRYLGSTRSAGLVFTPSASPNLTSGLLTVYARNTNSTSLLSGSYWVDILIKGYWK